MSGFLDKIYKARGADETRRVYDDWAGSYDDEVGGHGYATPERCARALSALVADPATAPILDFGCGTGLSGLALSRAGFKVIDGVDLSEEMLEEAEKKNIYRSLRRIEAGAQPVARRGEYAAIAAIGVIGAGAAPISVFDALMSALEPGGFLVFSFNDHALEDPGNEGRVSEWTDTGHAQLRFREYGDHLPGIGLRSMVYVIQRL